MRLAVVVLVLSLVPLSAWADTPTVSGIVLDGDRRPVGGIAVELYVSQDRAGDPADTDTTASNGVYNLTGGSTLSSSAYVVCGDAALIVTLKEKGQFRKGKAEHLVVATAGAPIKTAVDLKRQMSSKYLAERILIWAGAKSPEQANKEIVTWTMGLSLRYKGPEIEPATKSELVRDLMRDAEKAKDLPKLPAFDPSPDSEIQKSLDKALQGAKYTTTFDQWIGMNTRGNEKDAILAFTNLEPTQIPNEWIYTTNAKQFVQKYMDEQIRKSRLPIAPVDMIDIDQLFRERPEFKAWAITGGLLDTRNLMPETQELLKEHAKKLVTPSLEDIGK